MADSERLAFISPAAATAFQRFLMTLYQQTIALARICALAGMFAFAQPTNAQTRILFENFEGVFLHDILVTGTPAQPNLRPYQPSGWSSAIVVSKSLGTTVDEN